MAAPGRASRRRGRREVRVRGTVLAPSARIVTIDPDRRWYRRVRGDDYVDVWLISWATEQYAELHDHGGSSGALTVDDLLSSARARLDRPDPRRAAEMVAAGAILVDTRPGWQRAREGELDGALLIERNHIEWRLDPTSDARIAQAVDHDVSWIVVCSEGYSSSLAAASLQDIGLRNATDLDGGYRAWRREFG